MRNKTILFLFLMTASMAVMGIDIKPDGTGMSQGDLVTFLTRIRDACNNRHLAKPAVIVATQTKEFEVPTDTWIYNGIIYASATNNATFTVMPEYAFTSFATNQQANFVFGRISTGFLRVIQGPVVSSTDTAKLPDIPASMTPIFYVNILASGMNASFTAGTSPCTSAASITPTVYIMGSKLLKLQD